MVKRDVPGSWLPPGGVVPNLIGGAACLPASGASFDKLDPADGVLLWRAAASGRDDVDAAVGAAATAQAAWAEVPGVRRGLALHRLVVAMEQHRDELAGIVAAETGKSLPDAQKETDGAIQVGLFYAGEGQRLFGRTTTSTVPGRHAMTLRQPVGVAGLVVPANTPIANVAWKVFPALVCGNAAVLKSAEDAPATAWAFGRLATEAGLPKGVLAVVHGLGSEAGAALVAHPRVDVVSFTGSSAVGRQVQAVVTARMARVSLELGGKNPFVVLADADLDHAVTWAALSAFSNAGQRCAAASRIIVAEAIHDVFVERLVARAAGLRVGTGIDADLGPVINERQMRRILGAVEGAVKRGARVLVGGHRLNAPPLDRGYFIAPTLLADVAPADPVSREELFGPVACVYRVAGFEEALALANDADYALTACVHTRDVGRAFAFVSRVVAGVAVVNAGTYGSEPHMPFGGLRMSGNGMREPGPEALDVYTNLKTVYVHG